MTIDTSFDPSQSASFLMSQSHNGWLGLEYRDHGKDWVELKLPWRADLIGEDEDHILASGPIISLMDMASGMAIWTRTGKFEPIATLDLRVDYLRPSRPRGTVFGRSRCYRTTRSAAFVEGIAHEGDMDNPVARVQGVFMSIDLTPQSVNNG